jgi:hypothetical protein
MFILPLGIKGSKYVPSLPGSAAGAPSSAAKKFAPGRVHARHDAFADDEAEAEEEVHITHCCLYNCTALAVHFYAARCAAPSLYCPSSMVLCCVSWGPMHLWADEPQTCMHMGGSIIGRQQSMHRVG